jgi:hypothetical protein
MRTEDGVFCDIRNKKTGRVCGNQANYVHPCKIEGSEFAFCKGHEAEWKAQTTNQPNFQVRCPRCLPQFLASVDARLLRPVSSLPEPITGPLADAIDMAMYREGILTPIRMNVLRRLGKNDSSYVNAIFRSTANTPDQQQVQAQA